MVIELKAVPVTEKVVGQVMRYKLAVSETFSALCSDIGAEMGLDFDLYYGEDRVSCAIIAPGYDKVSLHSIGHIGWPLVATMQDDGRFDIRSAWRRRTHRVGYGSPTVGRLLEGAARQFIGWNIGCAWRTSYIGEQEKIGRPWSYYDQGSMNSGDQLGTAKEN